MLDRNKHIEAGYIGEEFFADLEKDRLHKCIVVEEAISEGYFSFEEALAAYEMDREEYEQYIARKSSDVISLSISGSTITLESKSAQPAYFEIFAKMINHSDTGYNDKINRKIKRIKLDLLGISKEIEEIRSATKESDLKEKA